MFRSAVKMDDSFLKSIFMYLACVTIFIIIIINIIHFKISLSTSRFFLYSKFSDNVTYFLSGYLEIPRECFKHFYTFAVILSTNEFLLAVFAFIFKLPIPEFVIQFLNIIDNNKNRQTAYNATACTLAMFCMLIQCWKRCYETHYLSIFSKSKMSIFAYTIGYIHYSGCLLAILAEAPFPFTPYSIDHHSYFSLNDINIRMTIGVTIFLCATYQQHMANVILANLRRNKDGEVTTYEHKIPTGGLFDMVSCPHMLFEVLIYMAICIILWGSHIWPYIFLWVLNNQYVNAMFNHWWYQSKFKTYPKVRRAIIPYIL